MTPQEYEAEIARLTQGYEDLKEYLKSGIDISDGNIEYKQALIDTLDEFIRITGEGK